MGAKKELHAYIHQQLEPLRITLQPYKNDKDGFPYIQIGETFDDQQETNKTRLGGTITQYFHVWHNDLNQSGTVNTICDQIIYMLRAIKSTENFQWRIMPNGVSINDSIEYSQNVALLRTTIDVEFRYY